MKGSLLKPFTGSTLYGQAQFLAAWQEDVVKALRTCHMGDRDSYPGDYHHRLVDDGFISQDELIEACCLYLTEQGYAGAKKPYQHGLDDVLALAMTPGYELVAQCFSDQFDELLPLMSHRKDFYWKFLYASLLGPRRQYRVWLMAKELLEKEESFNGSLFEEVYGAYSYCTKDVRIEREAYLQALCKRIRRLRGQVESPYDPDNLLSTLEQMLHFHFGLVWKDYQAKEENERTTLFQQVMTKTKNWLRAQNAHATLPV